MKRKIALLTTILLLLGTVSACGDSTTSVESTITTTVANLFAPTTVPTETETQAGSGAESTQSENSSPSKKDVPTPGEMGGGLGLANDFQEDALGIYTTYDGGEMHVFLWFTLTGYSEIGIGIHLFVDGQPQAYYTPEDSTYSYMHTLYPPENEKYVMELIFVPVAGEAGDTLEYGFFMVVYPDYFLNSDWAGIAQSGFYVGLTFRVKYQETPPASEIVPVQDRVLSKTLTYEDLTSDEIADISQGEVEYTFYVNGKSDFGYFWNVAETDTVTVRFVLEGSSLAQFGLVVFYNHEPVSVSPEDLMFVSTNNGQKAILEAEIDISDFDGEGVLYAVVVPRNYKIDQLGDSCSIMATGTYYFSSAASREELMAQSGVS